MNSQFKRGFNIGAAGSGLFGATLGLFDGVKFMAGNKANISELQLDKMLFQNSMEWSYAGGIVTTLSGMTGAVIAFTLAYNSRGSFFSDVPRFMNNSRKWAGMAAGGASAAFLAVVGVMASDYLTPVEPTDLMAPASTSFNDTNHDAERLVQIEWGRRGAIVPATINLPTRDI